MENRRVSPPDSAVFFGEDGQTERRVDSNQQGSPGLLSMCVQGSVHLNSQFFSLPPYCTTVIISATRSPLVCFL